MSNSIPTQPILFNDFSGGKTDNHLKCNLNQYQEADNFLISPDKRLITRSGQLIYNSTYYQTPGGQRIGALIVHDSELFFQSARNIYYIGGAGWVDLTGPSGNAALGAGTTSSYVSYAIWNRHLIITNDAFSKPQKIYKDSGGVFRVRTAGMPDLATPPTVTAGGAGANNYIYRFIYYYSYTVGSVTFQDFGPVTQVALASALAPNTSTVAITAIPVLANGATDNYDTAAIKVKIYRTENNGTVYYFLGEVTNGTTTFNDSVADATLITNERIYTEGGVLDNDPPPLAKYVVTANDIVWYGYIKEGSSEYPSRIRQSIKFDPDSCPTSLFHDLEDDITGLGNITIYPLVFCKNHVYRIEGFYDSQGRGVIQPREISRTVGCISNLSIVNTLEGTFFAGNDGFYFTDGYRLLKISDELNESYKGLIDTTTKQKNIYGFYDSKENRVYWACQEPSANSDNDNLWVLDLRWGIKRDSSFTTFSGGGGFSPTAITNFNGTIITADKRGYAFKFDANTYDDPKINIATAPANWERATVIYDYKGPSVNFGTTAIRKWVPKCTILAENVSNISMGVFSNNDNSGNFVALKEIRYSNNIIWGDPNIIWGSTQYDYSWNVITLIDAKRRFPAGNMRCEFKQMRYTNALTIIYNSDTFGLASVDGALNQASLVNYPTETWPTDVIDYFISFETDSYVTDYLILARTNQTITFLDATNSAPTGSKKWIVRGYRKGEVLNLIAYSIYFSMISDSQITWKGITGGNA